MAEIWFAKSSGDEPTRPEADYERPLSDCIKRLGLKQSHYCCDLTATPRFDRPSATDAVAPFRHVVVEVAASEASAQGWTAGFYLLANMSITEAGKLLSD
jgi:hypothetical protein